MLKQNDIFFIEVYEWIDNFSYNYFESKYWNRFHWKYSFQINKLNKKNFWFPILYTTFPIWWMNITRWGQGFNFENKFRKGIQDLPDSLKSMVIDQMEKAEGKHRSLDGKSRSIGAKLKFVFEFPQRDFLLYLAPQPGIGFLCILWFWRG